MLGNAPSRKPNAARGSGHLNPQKMITFEINDKKFLIYVTPANDSSDRKVTIQNALNPVEFNDWHADFFDCNDSDSNSELEVAAYEWLKEQEEEAAKMKCS